MAHPSVDKRTQIESLLDAQREAFESHSEHTAVEFSSEKLFVLQVLMGNDKLASSALSNPAALVQAFLKVAAIGITLNPERKFAYLLWREGRITLSISAQGLRHIAESEGAIRYAVTELVYSNDQFRWNGFDTKPDHVFDVFASEAERGTFRGAYCVAKLGNGELMVTRMSAEAVNQVRSTSRAQGPSSPWVMWFDQMVAKTVMRRASKSWPSVPGLDRAIQAIDAEEGLSDEYLQDSPPKASSVHHLKPVKTDQPAKPAEPSKETIGKVASIIARARAENAWTTAMTFVQARFIDANGYSEADRDYALTQLSQAQSNASQPTG